MTTYTPGCAFVACGGLCEAYLRLESDTIESVEAVKASKVFLTDMAALASKTKVDSWTVSLVFAFM